MQCQLWLQPLHWAPHSAQILLAARELPSARTFDGALIEAFSRSGKIVAPNQNAMNGSVNITRTGTLSTRSGNCGLAELVLST
jgi:hypothetical protein